MGRLLRKSKLTMEVSQSALGVKTRARTLAMAAAQQQQQQSRKNNNQPQVNVLNFCYLELRNRKLEKFFEADNKRSSRKPPKTTQQQQQQQQQRRVSTSPISVQRTESNCVVSVGAAISRSNSLSSTQLQGSIAAAVANHLDEDVVEAIEASCGDNEFDHEAPNNNAGSFGTRIRESTPTCSEQKQLQLIAPGSSSRARLCLAASADHQARPPSSPAHKYFRAPSREEIDNFFAELRKDSKEEESRLSDRYNFDFVNDVPLPGRFEWTPSC